LTPCKSPYSRPPTCIAIRHSEEGHPKASLQGRSGARGPPGLSRCVLARVACPVRPCYTNLDDHALLSWGINSLYDRLERAHRRFVSLPRHPTTHQIEDRTAIEILLSAVIPCPRTHTPWLILETNWYSRSCSQAWFSFGQTWMPSSLGELRARRPRQANDLICDWLNEPSTSRLFIEPDWNELHSTKKTRRFNPCWPVPCACASSRRAPWEPWPWTSANSSAAQTSCMNSRDRCSKIASPFAPPIRRPCAPRPISSTTPNSYSASPLVS
jgi:hypothetical protein